MPLAKHSHLLMIKNEPNVVLALDGFTGSN